MEAEHKSGFVNIIGNPNVGKSTLTNALMKDKLSIVNSKPQTTRHRMLGLISDEHYQIVLSDSPGIIDKPHYELQKRMNDFAFGSFEDADILLFVTDIFEEYKGDEYVIQNLSKSNVPKFLIINKIDLDKDGKLEQTLERWEKIMVFDKTFTISAMNKTNTDELLETIIANLPAGPAYYPKDDISDKSERFFASEIIRNNILSLYRQEIPYSSEVVVDQFKDDMSKSGPMLRIRATIFVERPTQKSIIIGDKGSSIKKLGTNSRIEIETFFEKKVFLELFVSVKEDWRSKDRNLKEFGYH